MLHFLEYKQNNARITGRMNVVPVGFYWPGANLAPTAPAFMVEADIPKWTSRNEDPSMVPVTTSSKTPIQLGSHIIEKEVNGILTKMRVGDDAWLENFHPKFHTRMLAYRYGELIMWAAKKKINNEPIPDRVDSIPMTFNQTEVTFIQDIHGRPGIPLYIEHLLDKLADPRDLMAFAEMSPEEARKKYKGGLYGYNFNNPFTHPKTQEQFADAYVAMTLYTARKVIESWRHGMMSGLIDCPDIELKEQSLGGGAPTQGAIIDRNGNIITGGLQGAFPTRSQKWIKENIGDVKLDGNGMVNYTWLQGSERVTEPAYIAAYCDGQLVDSSARKKYNETVKKVNALIEEGKQEEAQNTAKKFSKSLSNFKKYDVYEYNIHRFNKERVDIEYTDSKGRKRIKRVRKYPRLYNDKIVGIGMSQPLSQQPEYIQGKQAHADELGARFHQAATYWDKDDQITQTIGPGTIYKGKNATYSKEELRATSAVRRGVAMFLRSIEGSKEFDEMSSAFDDLVQAGAMHIAYKAGEPWWVKYINAVNDPNVPMEVKKKMDQEVSYEVMDEVADMASRLWQLDWGRGTRAARSRNMGAAASMLGTEFRPELGGTAVKSLTSGGDTDDVTSPGRYRGVARGDSASGSGVLSDPRMTMAHHISNIRTRTIEYAKRVRELQQQRNYTKVGSKDPWGNMTKDLVLRQQIMNEYMQAYIANSLSQGKKNWDAKKAQEWARTQMIADLKSAGVSLSDINKVEAEIKSLGRIGGDLSKTAAQYKSIAKKDQESMQKAVNAAITDIEKLLGSKDSAFAKLFLTQGKTKELLQSPEERQDIWDKIQAAKEAGLGGPEMTDQIEMAEKILQAIEDQAKLIDDAFNDDEEDIIASKVSNAVDKEIPSKVEDIVTPEMIKSIISNPKSYQQIKAAVKANPEFETLAKLLAAVDAEMAKKSSTDDEELDPFDNYGDDNEEIISMMMQDEDMIAQAEKSGDARWEDMAWVARQRLENPEEWERRQAS